MIDPRACSATDGAEHQPHSRSGGPLWAPAGSFVFEGQTVFGGQTTVKGSSFLPVGPIWISVSMVGQTPQS
jgi:hypothetical protein